MRTNAEGWFWRIARAVPACAALLMAAAGALAFREFWIALHPPAWWILDGFEAENYNKPYDALLPISLVFGAPLLLGCIASTVTVSYARKQSCP